MGFIGWCRWASRKLRHWGIVVMRKRNRAASAITFWWFRLRPGRLLRHLEERAQRIEDEEVVSDLVTLVLEVK